MLDRPAGDRNAALVRGFSLTLGKPPAGEPPTQQCAQVANQGDKGRLRLPVLEQDAQEQQESVPGGAAAQSLGAYRRHIDRCGPRPGTTSPVVQGHGRSAFRADHHAAKASGRPHEPTRRASWLTPGSDGVSTTGGARRQGSHDRPRALTIGKHTRPDTAEDSLPLTGFWCTWWGAVTERNADLFASGSGSPGALSCGRAWVSVRHPGQGLLHRVEARPGPHRG